MRPKQSGRVTKLFILLGGNMLEEKVKEFNQYVESVIREKGTCKIADTSEDQVPTRIAVFEADCYRADDSIDGFVGWWDDDHGITTHAATPYEVFCDMP